VPVTSVYVEMTIVLEGGCSIDADLDANADIRREAIEFLMNEGSLFSTIDDLVSLTLTNDLKLMV
jgi:hypothetical protein